LAGGRTNRKQLTCHIQLFIFSSLLHCSEAGSKETAEAQKTGGSNSTMKKPESQKTFEDMENMLKPNLIGGVVNPDPVFRNLASWIRIRKF
jgi:hypothetical protein